jgi:hypothetical protein
MIGWQLADPDHRIEALVFPGSAERMKNLTMDGACFVQRSILGFAKVRHAATRNARWGFSREGGRRICTE